MKKIKSVKHNYQPSTEEHRKAVELQRNHKRYTVYVNRQKTLDIRGLI